MADRTRKQAPRPPLSAKLAAELFGTFVITLAAAGSDIVDHLWPHGLGVVARFAARGLSVMAMIWALSGVSGAHINPAISLAFFFRRAFKGTLVAPYIVAQFLGAILAALLLQALFAGNVVLGISKPSPPFTDWQAFAAEIVLTTLLAFTILGTADQKATVGKNDALAVGGIVAMCGFAFSPVSGASMNPARTLGPMIVSLHFEHALVYIFAPIIGAGIAALLCSVIYGAPNVDSRKAAQGKGT